MAEQKFGDDYTGSPQHWDDYGVEPSTPEPARPAPTPRRLTPKQQQEARRAATSLPPPRSTGKQK
ncbi:MAG TPA: hypothetical protein VLB73_00180 [Patescibacteria group bacterium]|nr:hypothetical protein [Patescibacteria group bacterium]